MLSTALIIVVIILVLASIFSIIDNIVQVEAHKSGIDTTKKNMGIFPSFGEFFAKPTPDYIDKSSLHRLSKGHDILVAGKANGEVSAIKLSRYAIKPGDFRGIAPIPKMEVEEGSEVKAGDALFYNKANPEIKYVSPVSGELVEIRRGTKRSITHLVILADKEQNFKRFEAPKLNESRESIVKFLMSSGAWTHINQRPFDIVPNPEVTPDNIFISCFDTAPLAVDSSKLLDQRGNDLQAGLDVLNALTDGNVYLGLDGRSNHKPHDCLLSAKSVKSHWFTGKHPAGNVGIQIHHIAPIKASTTVWTLKLEDVLMIGKLFSEGIYDTRRVLTLCGAQFENPSFVFTYAGASINELLKDQLKTDEKSRIIQGNVLSGDKKIGDDFLGAKYNMITAIPEGDYYELFGWLLPIKPRPSVSGTFPNFLLKNHEFNVDTNTHGEKRAFVMTGQYEKVLPMDIYPQHLLKSVMAGDIERMEALGINELTEEDLALAEFCCTSKMPLQSILRDGLEMMREQA